MIFKNKNNGTNKSIAGLIVLCLAAAFSCKQKAPDAIPPVPVNLYTVAEQKVVYYDNYPGTIQASNQVNLIPVVQGYITGIYFKEGGQVVKGQKLYQIDQRLYQSNYDNQAANLKVAQDNLAQAKQDADRYTYLNNNNTVAKQLYDHAMVALQVAQSQVKAAQEVLKGAKTNLNYAIITAPYSGTIGISQVKLGNMVSTGQTVLNTISTNDPMVVDFLLNEKQLPQFEKLQNQPTSALPDSLFTLQLPDTKLYSELGKIQLIDRAVDSQTGSITVRLSFPNPKNQLIAGMSCVVRVHNQDTAKQILIPSRAVTEQMGEYFVFTTDPKAKEMTAVQKKIIPGQTIGANVIVVSGLALGEQLIVDGIQSLHDGSSISVGQKTQKTTH